MPGQKYDILVVDDQAGLRRLICETLFGEGYMIDQAAGGLEAVEKLSRNKYRLILLDVKMPGMNGLDTLKEIRKINGDVPVVMMTAYDELNIAGDTGYGTGPVQHISKPFDLDDLRKLVRVNLSDDYDLLSQTIHG
ncbi:response regulator [Desulfoscipio sp. XC116]|uniref:response regulator n=1 Tax=Desulfoscipio sp. XC116 TaxID=3144975 RepID=UPI00325C0536